MNNYTYITLRERPELKARAVAWFNSKWGVPTQAYLSCMDDYLAKKKRSTVGISAWTAITSSAVSALSKTIFMTEKTSPRISVQGHSGQVAQQRR